MKKFVLTNEMKKLAGGTIVYRICAVRNFALADGTIVHSGDLGGWVEKEDNLFHHDTAWVGDDAIVYGNARVGGRVWIHGNALVHGNARIYDTANVHDNAEIHGNSLIYGDAHIYGNVIVSGHARIYDSAEVCEEAEVFDNARVCDESRVNEKAKVFGDSLVYGKAHVFGSVMVYGNAMIGGNAEVCNLHDYSVFKNTWSSGRFFTFTRSNKMWIAGCFHGTGEELIAKAYKDSVLSGKCYETIVRAQIELDKTIEKTETQKEEVRDSRRDADVCSEDVY